MNFVEYDIEDDE